MAAGTKKVGDGAGVIIGLPSGDGSRAKGLYTRKGERRKGERGRGCRVCGEE